MDMCMCGYSLGWPVSPKRPLFSRLPSGTGWWKDKPLSWLHGERRMPLPAACGVCFFAHYILLSAVLQILVCLASHWAACMGGVHQDPCACCQADLADLAITLSLAPLSQLHHDLVYILKYLSFASFLVRMVFPKGIFQLCTCQPACYGSCNATSQVMLSPVGTVLQAST